MMKHTLWTQTYVQRPLAIALPGVIVAALIAPPVWSQAFYQDFNEILLKPGQSQTIDVRSANPELRVCNDSESTARVAVAIGSNPTQLIGPGRCTEDLGETIALRNEDQGSAVVTYRPINSSSGGS
ncbi:MAG: hypothetical protein QOK29_3158 [Rhodospirillaceae bacterium]|jgi:hypothetical protein|nr:hypothetical protein [Rhodospirillaceae bacterium]